MSASGLQATTASRHACTPENALTLEAIENLVSGLFDPMRAQPWVVVTTGFDSAQPSLDVEQLVADVGDVARVHIIATGELTRHFSNLLPDRLSVFGGAGRSYPVGFNAGTPPSDSPLRSPHATHARATERLVTDALNHAHAAGLFEQAPQNARAASGTIQGFLADGSRAIVALNDGSMATVWQELSFPPVPLDWVLQQGQHVTGVLDLETRRLSLEKTAPTAAVVEAEFPHRSVTLALVREVFADRAVLALHPDFELRINLSDVSPNPLDSLNSLLTVGEVVPVRMLHLQGGVLHLSLSDVDDDEPIGVPFALLPHGPPWLAEGRPLRNSAEQDELRVIDAELPIAIGRTDACALDTSTHDASVASGSERSVKTSRSTVAPPRQPHPRPGPGLRVVTAPIVVLESAPASQQPIQELDSESPEAANAGIANPATTRAARPSTALRDTQLSLAAANARIAELDRQIREVGSPEGHRIRYESTLMQLNEARAELGESLQKIRVRDDQLAAQRRELRATRREPRVLDELTNRKPKERRALWLCDEEWIKHEIACAWAQRVDACDKAEWPLPAAYVIGEGFAPSLEKLDSAQFDKALKCVADVLTDRARRIPGRQVHALRSGDGADDSPVVRQDSARCLRAAIEVKSASARRLHYWILPNGTIELSRVVLHDDMTP